MPKNNRKRKRFERVMLILTVTAAFCTLAVLLYLIAFVVIKGLPYLKPSLFAWKYNSDNVSLLPALISTLFMMLLSLLIALPIGLFGAIYLTEYAKLHKFAALVTIMAETLSGIPSILYGLFGMLCFVSYMGLGYSLLSGAITLSMMILPLILRSSQEALKTVPDIWKEGAYGLGAGKIRTLFRIVLPAAAPGIFAGVILAIGRVVGETAALIYTAGTVAQIPATPLHSARTLAVHMYALSGEGLHMGEGYATAIVLLVFVVGINTLFAHVAKRIGGVK
ncbi:MAG: phosphate ABC transporter permease PstA [Clostridium sp.]|jgi:phosphate transport system permease protein|nr:phosphate ABC transporter permease PstA [Clostridium sp.]